MNNVILDVDTGVDDALALMLALAAPQLNVLAVTCVGGNVGLPQVVENTLHVLQLSGGGNIPVAAGMHRPLLEAPQDASYVHGHNGLADIELPPHGLQPVREHAVELMRSTLLGSESPVTLIALAPMTNIAVLLRMYPDVINRIERIVFMGGAIGAGNATAAAEFNTWHDPEAAAIVIGSGIPMTMYGLEPFYEVTCDPRTIDELRASGRKHMAFAGQLLAHLATVTEDESRIADAGHAAIGDAGAVCAAIDPEGLRLRRAPVEVSLQGPATRGQTVVDLRTGLGAGGEVNAGAGGGIDVVLGADVERYRRLFLDSLALLP